MVQVYGEGGKKEKYISNTNKAIQSSQTHLTYIYDKWSRFKIYDKLTGKRRSR